MDKGIEIYPNSNFCHGSLQMSPEFPVKHSIKHIRRLSKAITGALYPVLSDLRGQLFFDIQTAASEMIIV